MAGAKIRQEPQVGQVGQVGFNHYTRALLHQDKKHPHAAPSPVEKVAVQALQAQERTASGSLSDYSISSGDSSPTSRKTEEVFQGKRGISLKQVLWVVAVIVGYITVIPALLYAIFKEGPEELYIQGEQGLIGLDSPNESRSILLYERYVNEPENPSDAKVKKYAAQLQKRKKEGKGDPNKTAFFYDVQSVAGTTQRSPVGVLKGGVWQEASSEQVTKWCNQYAGTRKQPKQIQIGFLGKVNALLKAWAGAGVSNSPTSQPSRFEQYEKPGDYSSGGKKLPSE